MRSAVPSRYQCHAPGTRFTRLNELGVRAQAHYLLRDPELTDPLHAAALITGNQLAVSSSGLEVAFVNKEQEVAHIVHTVLGRLKIGFADTDARGHACPPQILQVTPGSVLVWGVARGADHASVWFLSQRQNAVITPIHRLEAAQRNRRGLILVGQVDGQRVVATAGGMVCIEPSAQVSILNDGSALVIERYAGHSLRYTYRFTQRGRVEGFTYAPCGVDEVPIRALEWRGRFHLAVRGEKRSYLREFGGSTTSGSTETELNGILEMAWSSPDGESIATLVRQRTGRGWTRYLRFNAEVVHEGRFTMDPKQLFWSPSGKHVAAVIADHIGDGQTSRELVVGSMETYVIPSEHHVRELLVMDRGGIEAMLLEHEGSTVPIIRDRIDARVAVAWNLHRTREGAVVYNSVQGDWLTSWVDWSE